VTPRRGNGPGRGETTAVALCVGLFVLAAIVHARVTSATYDETAHLPAGYAALAWRDFRMNPEHPPLAKMLAALPLWSAGTWPVRVELRPEDLAPGAGRASLLVARQAWTAGLAQTDAQWLFGHFLLYGPTDDALRRLGVADPAAVPSTARLARRDFVTDADRALFLGRLPGIGLGALLAVLVFAWARTLHGAAGGLLAVALFAFDPNFVAHASLVTTDVGASLFLFAAVYAFWGTCRRLHAGSAAAFAVACGLAAATKFSAVVLAPVVAVLALARVVAPDPWPAGRGGWALAGWRARLVGVTALAALAAAVALGALWGVYGFRWSAARDPAAAAAAEPLVLAGAAGTLADPPGRTAGHFPIEWMVRRGAALRLLAPRWPEGVPEPEIARVQPEAPLTAGERALLVGARHRLLPEAYLHGLAFAAMKSHQRAAFLRGRHSRGGFRSFFLWAFLLKTPLPTLLAIGLGAALAFRRHRWWPDLAFLVVPVAVYGLASLGAGLSIGHRHLLPIYPFLFVLAGGLARGWAGRRRALALAVVALGGTVVLAPPWRPVAVPPNYLAYFNELAGGPRNGHRSMVDSNLDWGQDLKRLRAWLDRRGVAEPINLAYFGTADPRYHGIPHVNLPGGYLFEPVEPFARAHLPGYVAVSATVLQGAYLTAAEREAWRRFLAGAREVGRAGRSIFVYRVER
jgi:4-amino-4-deoxy-L-arabinose transferase-like glycosyltransferase